MTMSPASSTSTSLSSLERQRQHLESTIRDLQTSLYNWRLWEAEYDGLKLALQENRGKDGSDVDTAVDTGDEEKDMLQVALEYTSSSSSSASPGEKSVLSEKEVRDIVSGGKATRTREQVVSLLDRRIDYVRENVRVLEKRVADAERKLENWMGAIAVEDEEGSDRKGKGSLLPVTEIVEELDEEGNVLKGQTMRAGESAAELLDMLKKAGVEGLEDRKKGGGKVSEESSQLPPAKEVATSAPTLDHGKKTRETALSPGQSAAPAGNAPSVSNVSDKSTSTNGAVPDESKGEDDNDSIVMEVDESPEDAALRREMIQYGLQEVGAVVAELELDDDGSEFSVSDDDCDYDEEDEDEDEYGRSTRRMIDEDYHRQMRELEQKLNARGIQNIGPDASVLPEEVQRELNGELKKVSLQGQDDNNLPEKKSSKPKKRVAFAEDLDIAPDSAPAPSQVQIKKKDKVVTSPEVAPIQEQIIERTERDRTTNASETKPPKKVSRFRSARQAKESTPAATPTLPTMPQSNHPRAQTTHPSPQNITLFPAKPPEPKPFSQPIMYPDEPLASPAVKPTPTKILQDILIERPMVSNPSSAPAAPEHDPDDFDEAIHQREIASEFYRLRNRKIQQEGGFLRDDEPEIVPLDEDEDANEEPRGGRKMSRFMAARLKQQQ